MQQTVVYLLLIAITPVHLFPHRSLILEHPTDATAAGALASASSSAAATATVTTSSFSSLPVMDAQQDLQDIDENGNALRETLNSLNTAIVVTGVDNDHKPAFVQQMKQFMENSNASVIFIVDNPVSETSQPTNEQPTGQRVARQFYPIVALDREAAAAPAPSTGTGVFNIFPIAFDFRRAITAPFAAIFAPATPSATPTRIWAIGSVAKFPPFLEHLVQRIQSHYSIYKYEDLSRPGIFHSGGADQVIRVSPATNIVPLSETTYTATESKSYETTSTQHSTTTTTIPTTTTTSNSVA